MPLTWCYPVEGNQKYCATGFPMGCYVGPKGVQKDACVMDPAYNKPDTNYIFNHVDITITYHSGQGEDWGKYLGNDDGGRIVCKYPIHSVSKELNFLKSRYFFRNTICDK